MKTLVIVLVLVLVGMLAACGGKKDAKDNSAACAEAAKAATTALIGPIANAPNLPADAKAAMQEKGGKLADVIVKHCTKDGWGEDVIGCYKSAGSMNDMRACRGKLPEEQAKALLAEEMAVMSAGMAGAGGGGGGGGGPMMPPGH